MTALSVTDLANLLSKQRYRINDEATLQHDIAAHLAAHEVAFEKEARLSPGERIDFLVQETIGIEVKIKESTRRIYRQLERYAKIERVESLILVSCTAMGLPPSIGGKPVYIVNVGRTFL